MIAELKTLWELQEVDSYISRLRSRIEAIPQELQQLVDKLKLREAEAEKKKANEQELVTQRRQLEQDIEIAKDKVRKYKTQLLQVKTNKEYQALLHEINTEEVKISTYEEEQIEHFTESDKLKAQVEKLNKELDKKGKEIEFRRRKSEEELVNIKRELSLKEESHNKLAEKLPHSTLSRYEQIKRGRGGIGVVGIQGSVCEGCKALLPPQFVVELKKGDKIMTCEQCGRILVWK